MADPKWAEEAAKEVVSVCDEASILLERIVEIAEKELESEEEIKAVRRAVGGVLSDIFLNIVLPISDRYPNITISS